MPIDLESRIEIWAAEVDALPSADYYMEVTNALVIRDTIQDALNAGQKLSSSFEILLRKADDGLMAQREMLVARFPEVFWPDRQNAGPRSCWWWFLNEGPHVREEAERAA